MIHAEMRREGSGDGHYTLRYLVWNGDVLGTYGVHFGLTQFDNTMGVWGVVARPQDPEGEGYAYGASRDYHRAATPEQIAAYEAYEAFKKLPDAEQDKLYDEGKEPYAQYVDPCCYLDGKPACCDGSGLVEVVVGNDERCFEIAAMMADIKRQGD